MYSLYLYIKIDLYIYIDRDLSIYLSKEREMLTYYKRIHSSAFRWIRWIESTFTVGAKISVVNFSLVKTPLMGFMLSCKIIRYDVKN